MDKIKRHKCTFLAEQVMGDDRVGGIRSSVAKWSRHLRPDGQPPLDNTHAILSAWTAVMIMIMTVMASMKKTILIP